MDGHVVTVGGLRIAGLGGCVRYNDGPHQYTQSEYDKRARRLLQEARGAGTSTSSSPTHRRWASVTTSPIRATSASRRCTE